MPRKEATRRPKTGRAGRWAVACGFSRPPDHAMGFGHGSDLAGRSTSRRMRILGIETTCDETAAAVVRLRPDGAGEILADEVMSQIAAHAPFGGVVPEIAARAHVEIIDLLIGRALTRAKVAAT